MLTDDTEYCLQELTEALNECGTAIMEIRETEEYKIWEHELKNSIANIRECAQDFDQEKILLLEINCLNSDLQMHQDTGNEFGLRFAKQAKFQCLCALNFLHAMKKEPCTYMALAKACDFDDYVRIPRSDPFMTACLHLYTRLHELSEFTGINLYNYRPYYHARADNLRIAIRAHRRWQKQVLRGNA